MPRRGITLKQLQPAIDALRLGATFKIAADAAGVAPSTFYKYLSKGRNNESPKWAKFYKQVQEAEQSRALLMLQRIEEGARKDWRSAAWLLERRFNFRTNSSIHELPKEVEAKPLTEPAQLLRTQIEDLQKAIQKAATAQSWQAYAALQRQLLSMVQELKNIEDNDETADGLERMTDEQIIGQIEHAVLSMPPVLRQRLQSRLNMDTSNVVRLKKS